MIRLYLNRYYSIIFIWCYYLVSNSGWQNYVFLVDYNRSIKKNSKMFLVNPPADKTSREVVNLNGRKFCIPTCPKICDSFCLSVTNIVPKYLQTGRIEWVKTFGRTSREGACRVRSESRGQRAQTEKFWPNILAVWMKIELKFGFSAHFKLLLHQPLKQ